jgi:hypothetical protein
MGMGKKGKTNARMKGAKRENDGKEGKKEQKQVCICS